jgi:Arc/MetJ family transcription regulator
MVTEVRTTIEIDDALLAEAMRIAASEGTTLGDLVEDGLRRALAVRNRRPRLFRVRPVTFGGQGLRPGLDGASWEQVLRLAYEG